MVQQKHKQQQQRDEALFGANDYVRKKGWREKCMCKNCCIYVTIIRIRCLPYSIMDGHCHNSCTSNHHDLRDVSRRNSDCFV